jgi:hypothetical protein
LPPVDCAQQCTSGGSLAIPRDAAGHVTGGVLANAVKGRVSG